MMTLAELYSANTEWRPDTEILVYSRRKHGDLVDLVAIRKAKDIASLLAWGDCKVISFSQKSVLLKDAPELEN